MNTRISLSAFAALALAALTGAAGCETDAFCFADCPTSSTGGTGGATTGTGTDTSLGGFGGSGGGDCFPNCTTTSTGTSGCVETNGGIEKCDGLDNDCNGKVDDGVDYKSPKTCGNCDTNCYGLLLNCDPATITCDPGANPGSAPGTCKCGACSGDFWDLNGDQICEYYCVKSLPQDTKCDKKDNDCDGEIDEDVDLCASTTDCGKCGNNCVVVHGAPKCVNDGAKPCAPENTHCQIAQCDCKPGDCWWDLDGDYKTGCEYPCEITNGGVEICDGLDNDCNGKIDGADDLSGDPKVGGSCYGDPDGECATPAHAGIGQCQGGKIVCTGADVLHENDKLETCNGKDDDCDGTVDDSPTDAGASCGTSNIFPCSFGKMTCQNGALSCVGAINPTAEVCNGQDDDCDGTIDDSPGDAGGTCGASNIGACKFGTLNCQGGTLVCSGAVAPKAETCNGADDDCNGVVDDNVPGAGASCGQSGTAPCKLGTMQCKNAQMTCVGAINPTVETCNGKDDDCDGTVDDSPSDAGGSCGTSNVLPCKLGTKQCQNGALVCVGAIDPKTEVCNGVDDDCDGQVDKTGANPPADSVGTCNVPTPPPQGATSPCKAGSKACVAGQVTCQGSVGPSGQTDTCGVDANCDGQLTSQPNKQTDVLNCGACGNNCLAGAVHANWSCVSGACAFQGCQAGYYDLDGDKKCEYACTFVSATEACNGTDDNCNGQIDENVQKPSPTQVCGVSPSAGTAECTSQVQVACTNGAWKCSFPAGVCSPSCGQAAEICDGLDNDCDGLVNENVANYGKPCASDDGKPPPGDGACRTTGTYVCSGANATVCNAVKANCANLPGGCAETCDGVDNDCDGLVDEPFSNKGSNAANFVQPAVTKIGASLWAMSYEASRPNATTVSPGTGNGYYCTAVNAGDPNCNDANIPLAPGGVPLGKTAACSVASKIPWFNVTPIEAEQTCKARGGRLCTTADWQAACTASVGCGWGYSPRNAACTSAFVAGSKFCNLGPSFDFDPVAAGDQDGLLVTGSAALKNCWADWSGLQNNLAANAKIFDITGNLREITRSATNTYPLMGGSFGAQDENGATRQFTFYTVDQSFQLYDLGFRCCFTSDPTL